ncbi:hypothetical protein VNO78_08727 [Psophocarpus tetragonolobus]|uniref:Uncharacterized protein n=1 Tax=Psophocarpus tetragonolobus TaxID=3891 RepID=A0AAN9SXM2_PSOTE
MEGYTFLSTSSIMRCEKASSEDVGDAHPVERTIFPVTVSFKGVSVVLRVYEILRWQGMRNRSVRMTSLPDKLLEITEYNFLPMDRPLFERANFLSMVKGVHVESNRMVAILCALKGKAREFFWEKRKLEDAQEKWELVDRVATLDAKYIATNQDASRLATELKKIKLEVIEGFTYGFKAALEQATVIAPRVNFSPTNSFKVVKDGAIVDEK